MNIQYKNLNNIIITDQQAQGAYDKEYLQNDGQVKISERMFGSSIDGEVFFYRENEDVNQIVSQYDSIVGAKMLFIREREDFGLYTLINQTSYFRNQTTGYLELRPFNIRMINNSEGLTIASELINPSIQVGKEAYRSIGKVYYLGNFQTHPDGRIPDLDIIFTPDGLFDYAIYNPKLYVDEDGTDDDQDMEHLSFNEVMDMLDGLPEAMKDWYVNDVFLPPINIVT